MSTDESSRLPASGSATGLAQTSEGGASPTGRAEEQLHCPTCKRDVALSELTSIGSQVIPEDLDDPIDTRGYVLEHLNHACGDTLSRRIFADVEPVLPEPEECCRRCSRPLGPRDADPSRCLACFEDEQPDQEEEPADLPDFEESFPEGPEEAHDPDRADDGRCGCHDCWSDAAERAELHRQEVSP